MVFIVAYITLNIKIFLKIMKETWKVVARHLEFGKFERNDYPDYMVMLHLARPIWVGKKEFADNAW
jgi:hypothetical protein